MEAWKSMEGFVVVLYTPVFLLGVRFGDRTLGCSFDLGVEFFEPLRRFASIARLYRRPLYRLACLIFINRAFVRFYFSAFLR